MRGYPLDAIEITAIEYFVDWLDAHQEAVKIIRDSEPPRKPNGA